MNRWHQRCVCAVLVLALLQLPVAQAREDVDVRALANDSCIVADEPFFVPADPDADQAKILPLLGLVIGKVAELIIDHYVKSGTDRIRSGAARKDTRYAATREMNLYRAVFDPGPAVVLNARLGCLTIIAAKFKPDSTNCASEYVPKTLAPDSRKLPESQWRTTRADDSIENQLKRANVCIDGPVRAVYEARFEFSDDGTAYRLKSAGYYINSLLTTEDTKAIRSAFYTLQISQPGATAQHDMLSTAWVNIGTVSAGARSAAGGEGTPWLRVPALSAEARRAYEEQTKTHQEVMGEIEALQRALTRNQRTFAALDQHIADATGDVAEGLKQEKTKLAVQIQTQQAELESRNAEYHDLPQKPLEFMPVTIEVAITESESEKKELLALADVIDANRGQLASEAATELVSRGFNANSPGSAAPLKTDPGAQLRPLRAHYYDALVEVQSSAPGPAQQAAQQKLALAKSDYNDVRRSLGLELIQ